MGRLRYLVIHCTATPAGREVKASDIRRWHTSPEPEGRGWKQVGYTDMIHLDGTVERLVDNNEDANVDPWEITNGAKGYNSVSRHIVYVGGLEAVTDSRGRIRARKDKNGHTIAQDTRTEEQLEAMTDYVKSFHKRFPSVRIIGHNEVAAKDCPSFDVQKWLRSIGIVQ